jgi:hypothetical protein
MAGIDYICCRKCDVKLIYDGDRGNREWWAERFGSEPEIECPKCKSEPMAWMQEMPLQENEIRSVRMTSVKEVAEEWDHPIPLYTTPPPRPWVGLTEEEFLEIRETAERGNYLVALQHIQEILKEKNT